MTLDQALRKINELEQFVRMYRDNARREEKKATKYKFKWEETVSELEQAKDELCHVVMKKRKIRDHCLDQWGEIKKLGEDLKKAYEEVE